MLQIELAAQSNGAHRNQCSADNTPILEGFARVADDVDISQVPNISFVLLTVTDGVITSVADDSVSREAWEAQPKPVSAPTTEEKLRADVDYIAAMTGVQL